MKSCLLVIPVMHHVLVLYLKSHGYIQGPLLGVSNLQPMSLMQPRKNVNLLKTFFFAHQFLLVFVY